MGLDQAAANKFPAGIENLGLRVDLRPDRNDRTILHTDIDEHTQRPVRKLRVANDQVHWGAEFAIKCFPDIQLFLASAADRSIRPLN